MFVNVYVKMSSKQQTYQERAERLAKAIDIAKKIIVDSKSLDEKAITHFTNWGKEIKQMALYPKPQFKTLLA